MARLRTLVLALGVVLLIAVLPACARRAPKPVIVGEVPPATSLPSEPTVLDGGGKARRAAKPLPPPDIGRRPVPEPGPVVGLAPANGRPFRPPIPFSTRYALPDDLVFVLVIGSDARPGEDMRTARADSIHLLAVNPASQVGTVVGFPRDSWVEIPGHGKGKMNDALVKGGPVLLARTVERLTALPVHFYVLTAFAGMVRMVDALGGVDVYVDRRMNDRFSGARFEPGWHHFNGAEALAFSRNRMDVPYGDFSRSQNHGVVILAALAKMRAEVGDDDGVWQWVRVMLRDVELDVSRDKLPMLGALARRLDPSTLENIVVPGRVGKAGKQSVVYLAAEAEELFADLRDDAVRGDAPPPTTTTTERRSPATTTPSTAPPPPSTTAPPATQLPGSTTTTTARSTTTTAPDDDNGWPDGD